MLLSKSNSFSLPVVKISIFCPKLIQNGDTFFEKLFKAVWIGDSKLYYFLFEKFKLLFWKKLLKIEKNEQKYDIFHSEK